MISSWSLVKFLGTERSVTYGAMEATRRQIIVIFLKGENFLVITLVFTKNLAIPVWNSG